MARPSHGLLCSVCRPPARALSDCRSSAFPVENCSCPDFHRNRPETPRAPPPPPAAPRVCPRGHPSWHRVFHSKLALKQSSHADHWCVGPEGPRARLRLCGAFARARTQVHGLSLPFSPRALLWALADTGPRKHAARAHITRPGGGRSRRYTSALTNFIDELIPAKMLLSHEYGCQNPTHLSGAIFRLFRPMNPPSDPLDGAASPVTCSVASHFYS